MTPNELIEALALKKRADAPYAGIVVDLWSGSGALPSFRFIGEGYDKLHRAFTAEPAREVEAWCDYPYRVVWRFDELLTHVTYCEGDVDVLIARSAADYATINAHADRFYANH